MNDELQRIDERFQFYKEFADSDEISATEMKQINHDPITWIIMKIIFDDLTKDIDKDTIVDRVIENIMIKKSKNKMEYGNE